MNGSSDTNEPTGTTNPSNEDTVDDTTHDTDPTQQLPVRDDAPTEAREPVDATVFGTATGELGQEASAAAPAPVAAPVTEPVAPPVARAGAWPPPVPPRPTGPYVPAIILGLVALAVAGIVLAQELGNLTVDWADVGPLGFVAVGAVLVVLGVVGLVSSNRRNARS